MKKSQIILGLAGIAFLAGVFTSCVSVKSTTGLTLRDKRENFTIFTEGSVAENVTVEADGSVSWVATAAGGAGGGVAFYVNSDKKEINIANYKSIDVEFEYSPVEGKWNSQAQLPGFCMRILPWDSTGLFGGYEDLEYFDSTAISGTLTKTINIPEDLQTELKQALIMTQFLVLHSSLTIITEETRTETSLRLP